MAPDALVDPFSALKARLATKVAQGKQAAKIAGMQNIPPAAAPLSSSTIEKSNPTIAATDPQVRAVQQQLVSAGYKITVDGVMGPQTAAAMKAYTQAGGKLQAPPVVPQLEQGHAGAAPPPAPSFDFSQPVTSLNNVAAEKAASNSQIHAAAPDQAALEYQQMTSGENAQLGQEIAAAPKQAGPTATSAISDVSRFVVPAKPLNVDEYGNVSIDWPKFALDVAALGTNYGFGPNGVLPGAMSVPKITSLVKGSSAAVKLLKEGGSTLDALKAAKVVTSEGGNISPLLAFATPTISQAVANAPGGVVAGVQNFPKTMQQLFQSIGQGFTDYNHPAQMVMDWGMMLAATHGAAMRIHAGSQALASDGLRAAFSRPTHEGGSVFHAPPTAPRFITLPDGQQMPLLESTSHSMRLLQKLHDTLAEHFAAKFGETSKIGSYVTKRAGGFGTSARRISQPLEEAIANRLQGAVNRMVGGFTPYELRAFELTSFNTPVEVRLQQIERALSDAPDMAARIRLLHEHSLFTQIKDANITEVVRDPTGAPHVVIRQDVAPGLAAADGMVAQAGAEKDAIKIATGQMSEQGVRTRINAPGQIIRGGKYTNYSDAAKANLSESPERQAIIKALGVKESSSLIALLDSSAHGVAKEMGNPMHPEHYYSYLKQIHNVTDEMPPGALHQQLSLHDIPEFQKPLNPTEQSLRVSSITKVRANQIAKRVIAEGHDLPPSMSTAPKLGAAIKRIWDSAIPAQGQKDWYARAAKNATVVSDWYDIPEKNVVQLMAIYSQSANPSANMAFVIRAIEEFKSKGEITSMGAGGGAQRAKANAVLNGANWEGRKTNTYYNNIGQHIPSIVESGDITLGGVTVDRHAR